MPEFVSSDLKKIGTAIAFDGPSFAIVEVSVTTVYRKIRVCQSAARSIERITVAVLAYLESDFDVNLNESPLLGKNIILVIGRISIINKYIIIVAFHFYTSDTKSKKLCEYFIYSDVMTSLLALL